VENIWEGVYPEVKCKSASISCMHCLEPPCLEVCPVEAISKRPEDGIVVVDRAACISCESCSEACPYDVPQFGDGEAMQKCDMCVNERTSDTEAPPCVATCPTEALALVMMDAARKSSAEKAMEMLVRAARADLSASS
jgi:anaerobic dimethyl sulfoxide reductase subunit B (iron-sulfur subunit)